MSHVPLCRTLRYGCLLTATLLLHGCGFLEFGATFLAGPDRLKQLSIDASDDVNGRYPVAVDVLFIKDKRVLENLSKLRAADWFGARADYQRQYAQDLVVKSWEMVPGLRLRDIPVSEESRGSIASIVFADYPGKGAFRSSVTDRTRVRVLLKSADFEVVWQ